MSIFGKRKAGHSPRSTEVLERPEYGWIWKPLLILVVLYLLVTIVLGIWWSRPPASFDVAQATAVQRDENAEEGARAANPSAARGAVVTATLMTTVDTLLDKPGGYLRNDMLPPGLWLDNMPNWEYGVLLQARDLAQALAERDIGANSAFEEAHQQLMVDSRDWLYPSAEQRLERAVEALGGYLHDLSAGNGASFNANGDGLARWLDRVAGRLDVLTQRLSASVTERETLRNLDIDAEELTATPWYRIDDVFFEARGSGWALMHLLEAVERDFAAVLDAAGGNETLQRLVAELDMTQRRIWSPVILNGSGFGIFANHSLVMANYTARARDLAAELSANVSGVSVDEPSPAGGGQDASADQEAPESPMTREEGTAPGDASAEEPAASQEGEAQGATPEAGDASGSAGGNEPPGVTEEEASAPASEG
ncbi:DUF2333 family protein [Litchfieldella rifensis]|uniref:DUF2333 family protein n=1 Tax=Litchfieldella rifensis TaxID=762643 RepID=A0ABV7LW46_9GAMM